MSFAFIPLSSDPRRDLEEEHPRGWSDKCARRARIFPRGITGKDETFAAGSPLEAHGRFSKVKGGGGGAVAHAFLEPAFRSGNLMLVACHANIFSFISPPSFSPATALIHVFVSASPTPFSPSGSARGVLAVHASLSTVENTHRPVEIMSLRRDELLGSDFK